MSIKVLPVDNPYRISSIWLSRETVLVGLITMLIGLAMLTERNGSFNAPVWDNGPLLALGVNTWAGLFVGLGGGVALAPLLKTRFVIYPLIALVFVMATFGTLLFLAGQSNVAASAFGLFVLAVACWLAVLTFRTLDVRSEIQMARLRIARAEAEAHALDARWQQYNDTPRPSTDPEETG